ncbi:50S ribosomal protein L9 [Peptoniphilus raoultii]|uniref:50S ribosomal protein L9 n=1 Tax=Peptoniphilus raoultii TaxID=1776387 RepID=UPI0008DB017A|nr:50S ribosomal protein L9 [Peptoniphilus raoultii]
MKVILIKDDKNLGKAGNIVDAKDGYARNFLIPRKIAIEANDENMVKWKEDQKRKEAEEKENRKEAEELKKLIEKSPITMKVKAGEGGRLFGAITSKDIADKLFEDKKIEIDRKKINLPENIKTIGQEEIEIKLYPKISAKLKVKIERNE